LTRKTGEARQAPGVLIQAPGRQFRSQGCPLDLQRALIQVLGAPIQGPEMLIQSPEGTRLSSRVPHSGPNLRLIRVRAPKGVQVSVLQSSLQSLAAWGLNGHLWDLNGHLWGLNGYLWVVPVHTLYRSYFSAHFDTSIKRMAKDLLRCDPLRESKITSSRPDVYQRCNKIERIAGARSSAF
jgi:hypothetical protein